MPSHQEVTIPRPALHGRWVALFKSGKVVKMIDDRGCEHSYREVQELIKSGEALTRLGWEPVDRDTALLAQSHGVLIYPDALDAISLEVPPGVYALPPYELEERMNVMVPGLVAHDKASINEYLICFGDEVMVRIKPNV